MKGKELFQIIGEISDDFIMEAGKPAQKIRRIRAARAAALAAAIVILLSFTAFASSVFVKSRSSSSTNIPNYYTVPSQRTLKKDVGITPRVVGSFSNGYAFQSGTIAKNKDYGEDDKVVEKYKSLICSYKRGGDEVSLYIDGSAAGIQMEQSETAEIYKKSAIKYEAFTNKFFPPDYQLTEQDKKDEETGKYVFSFGTDTIELHEVQILGWEYGGLSYTICAMDNGITKEELLQMAKEIIDYQD